MENRVVIVRVGVAWERSGDDGPAAAVAVFDVEGADGLTALEIGAVLGRAVVVVRRSADEIGRGFAAAGQQQGAAFRAGREFGERASEAGEVGGVVGIEEVRRG